MLIHIETMITILVLSFVIATLAVPQVKLGRTSVTGLDFAASKVEFFGGIPFARPPVGQLRLKRPLLTTTIDANTFNAISFGPGCLQTLLPPDAVSEDCLTLNIFRPAGIKASANLPVMFWIYGGGFVSGATSLYNGTGIVSRSIERGTPVIFVSANYRVGPLGFPQGTESQAQRAENLGLQDQLAALKWIQANIGTFGGDKDKVTISGESAGAISISIHLLGSTIKGLARAAILESTASLPVFGPERNQEAWQNFVAAVPECTKVFNSLNTFDCLRTVNSSSLLQALFTAQIFNNSTFFTPVIDGPGGLLPDVPSRVTPKGRLPALIGSNLDEGALYTPQAINSTEYIRQFITAGISPSLKGPQALATSVEKILQLYPDIPSLGSPFGTGNNTFGLSSQYKRFAAIFGDLIFQSARRAFTQSMSRAGVKIFAYYFTDPDAVIPPGLTSAPPAPGSLGITHSSEIFYVFNTLANSTPTAVALSTIMQDYWVSFVTRLDPNDGRGSKRPIWQQYTPQDQIVMQLNGHDTRLVPDNFRAEQISFFTANTLVFNR